MIDNPLNLVGTSGANKKKGCRLRADAGVLSLPIHTDVLQHKSLPSLNVIGVTYKIISKDLYKTIVLLLITRLKVSFKKDVLVTAPLPPNSNAHQDF